jgi:hypothetical protein
MIRGRVARLGVNGILVPERRGIKRLRATRYRWIELEPGKVFECVGTALISREHKEIDPDAPPLSVAARGFEAVWEMARFRHFVPIDQPLERLVLRNEDGVVLATEADDDWFEYACDNCGRFDVGVFSQWQGSLSAFCGSCFQRLRVASRAE